MSTVWILNITSGVDDYKHRGESASNKSFPYSSKEKCMLKLASILVEEVYEYLEEYPSKKINKLPECITDFFEVKASKVEPEYLEYKFVKTLNELANSPNFQEIYELVTEAEFIPCKWDYTIKEHDINEPINEPIRSSEHKDEGPDEEQK
jgi:hypothetical protein